MRDRFNRIAARLTEALGSFEALVASVLLVVVWALTGPIFNFSDTWQLVINTTTTVVTFWMVFVIQNSANRDAKAMNVKLDELLRVHNAARNELITLEQQPEEVLMKTAEGLAELAQAATGDGEATVTVTENKSDGHAEHATATATARSKTAPPARSAKTRPTARTQSNASDTASKSARSIAGQPASGRSSSGRSTTGRSRGGSS